MKTKQLQLVVVLIIPFLTFAQYEKNEVVEFLSGTKYKLWYLDKYEDVMGGSDACEKGKAYTFYDSGALQYKECVNKEWKTEKYNYTIRTENKFDWWINFNGKEYALILKDGTDYQEVRFRDYGDDPDSKIEVTQDIVLKFLKDD